ncbi:MAG: hypothetical protein RID09_26935 [Coleofasciculus sp. G1-WW12-02]|uniref:hypothetical protein n=1 Tax=unclassified Coleofasciculus TaxID=2692782 RepID=UPI00330511AC
MFPFWNWDNACCGGEPVSRKTSLERKLKFLKAMRGDLEIRLAGLNAAIGTIEEQLNQDDTAQTL